MFGAFLDTREWDGKGVYVDWRQMLGVGELLEIRLGWGDVQVMTFGFEMYG